MSLATVPQLRTISNCLALAAWCFFLAFSAASREALRLPAFSGDVSVASRAAALVAVCTSHRLARIVDL